MKSIKKTNRQGEIETAAYALLTEVGYKKTSMLAIAKRASASNETLYKWYGNKQNLFTSLVKNNAEEVKEQLQKAITNQLDTIDTLRIIGPKLLKLVTSEKAIILNRAAAIDFNETNTLGNALSEQGKMKVAPLLMTVVQQGIDNGTFTNLQEDNNNIEAGEITNIFLSILVGDLQIRRVIGVHSVLKPKEVEERSKLALKCIKSLYIK